MEIKTTGEIHGLRVVYPAKKWVAVDDVNKQVEWLKLNIKTCITKQTHGGIEFTFISDTKLLNLIDKAFEDVTK